jgi:hypothetical protein
MLEIAIAQFGGGVMGATEGWEERPVGLQVALLTGGNQFQASCAVVSRNTGPQKPGQITLVSRDAQADGRCRRDADVRQFTPRILDRSSVAAQAPR